MFSLQGATYSPTSTPTSISSSIGFITASTMRPSETLNAIIDGI